MNSESTVLANPTLTPTRRALWVGVAIFLSYLGLVVNGRLFHLLAPQPLGDLAVVLRELLNLGMVVLIGWIVIRIEGRPLQSLGLHGRHWPQSLAWGVLLAVLCIAAAIGIVAILQAFGSGYGDAEAFSTLSLWTVTLITLRAGIAEEFMMRGYLLSRLEEWTGSTKAAVALTLIPFALLHFPQGPAGVLISFVLGGLLTAFFVWKRDLKANIVAHFLVDFLANVGIPLVAILFTPGS